MFQDRLEEMFYRGLYLRRTQSLSRAVVTRKVKTHEMKKLQEEFLELLSIF